MGCRMSLKYVFFDSYMNFFAENHGAKSPEHVERFYQNIASFKQRNQRIWNAGMLAGCYTRMNLRQKSIESPNSKYFKLLCDCC